MKRNLFFLFLIFILAACASIRTSDKISERGIKEMTPIDVKNVISAQSFESVENGVWESPVVTTPFPFDELIYSWGIQLGEGEAFRLYLKATFGPNDETSWLYGGFWGKPKQVVSDREKPSFDRGIVDMDWLKLKAEAVSYQFRIETSGKNPLTAPPDLTVVATDNHPTKELAEKYQISESEGKIPGRIFDLPLRRQIDSKGERMKSRCQSAALATAMQYFGKTVSLEEIVSYIHDPEYDYPGLWPRIIGAAGEFGFEGYIDRFRNWDKVRKALSENKVLLCSIRMAEGQCKSPPYPEMGNHIVALNGVTDDGRVVVTDSALGKRNAGYLCQWLSEDFEKIWMQTKGGISMVICPPPGFREKLVENLPPFPKDRQYPEGDNH